MSNVLSAWFVVNVLAPIILPIAGILPLTLVPVGVPVRLMAIVKDGQLCWTAVAMGASSLYETFAAMAANKPVNGTGGYLLMICILMLPAMVLAAAGSVFSTPLPAKRLKVFGHGATATGLFLVRVPSACLSHMTTPFCIRSSREPLQTGEEENGRAQSDEKALRRSIPGADDDRGRDQRLGACNYPHHYRDGVATLAPWLIYQMG
jgi:hypothetical protein